MNSLPGKMVQFYCSLNDKRYRRTGGREDACSCQVVCRLHATRGDFVVELAFKDHTCNEEDDEDNRRLARRKIKQRLEKLTEEMKATKSSQRSRDKGKGRAAESSSDDTSRDDESDSSTEGSSSEDETTAGDHRSG